MQPSRIGAEAGAKESTNHKASSDSVQIRRKINRSRTDRAIRLHEFAKGLKPKFVVIAGNHPVSFAIEKMAYRTEPQKLCVLDIE